MTDASDTESSGKLVSDALRDGMRAAYAAGYEDGLARGRAEAWDEIHAKIRAAYDEAVVRNGQPVTETRAPLEAKPLITTPNPDIATPLPGFSETGRATRGAVRKTVMAALEKGPTTIAAISEASGFKGNSVRSILYTLRGTGAVVRDGEVWTLTQVGAQQSDGDDPEADVAEVDQHPSQDDASAEVESGSPEGVSNEDSKDGEGHVSRAFG